MAEKLVLAYSGGLDTSVAIRWLQEKYNVDVITLTADLGNLDDMGEIKQRALDTKAIAAEVSPFPREETTPPVIKIYFGCIEVLLPF